MNRFATQTIRRFTVALLSAAGLILLLLLGLWHVPDDRTGATALAAGNADVVSSMHMTDTKSMTHTMPMSEQDMQQQMQAHMAQMMQMMDMEQDDPVQKGLMMQMMGLMMQMRGLMMQTMGMGDMPMDNMGMDNGADMGDMVNMAGDVTTGDLAPLVRGLYEGEELFFIHTEASDEGVAQLLTEMMGPQVVVVPELAETPDNLLADVYVFQNGVEGMGPFGFQPDVFTTVPGDEDYRPLHAVNLVNWADDAEPRLLGSVEEIMAAEADGELMIEEPGAVVNLPILIWPDGSR